jgi:predicted lipid-binding transport protein (Tim44 family)
MKSFLWMAALAAGLVFATAPEPAEAKRLGGAKSSGMQRSATPDKPAQPPAATPATPAPAAAAATPAAAGAAAAAAPKRSWMGPIAGLAAGLGIAALFSHLGMGAELANFVMLALLAVVAFVVIRLLMRRFIGNAGPQPALATAPAAAARPARPVFVDERPGMQRSALTPEIGSALKPPLAVPGVTAPTAEAVAPVATAPVLPAGFDGEGFERLARMLFVRMQAANDAADLDDLRQFTTPELFAALRLDLQDRGDARQTTDVVKVDAALVDFAQEDARQVVSVRFTGQIREEPGADAQAFDEVWHLVRPQDESRPWAIAGIQQAQ